MEINKTILVVDDQEPIRRVIELKLHKAGYKVITASDGEEGLRRIETCPPDVLVSDVNMPKLNGKDLCNLIQTIKKDHPFLTIILTGSLLGSHREWLSVLRETELMEKPFSLSVLLARIDLYCGVSRSITQ